MSKIGDLVEILTRLVRRDTTHFDMTTLPIDQRRAICMGMYRQWCVEQIRGWYGPVAFPSKRGELVAVFISDFGFSPEECRALLDVFDDALAAQIGMNRR